MQDCYEFTSPIFETSVKAPRLVCMLLEPQIADFRAVVATAEFSCLISRGVVAHHQFVVRVILIQYAFDRLPQILRGIVGWDADANFGHGLARRPRAWPALRCAQSGGWPLCDRFLSPRSSNGSPTRRIVRMNKYCAAPSNCG